MLSCCAASEKKIYISLGGDCSVAYWLGKLGLRQYAFPFDWVKSDIFNIIKVIETKFHFFFNSVKIVEIENLKFPVIDEDWEENIMNTYKIETDCFVFQHDKIEDFKEKYERRIKRFYEILEDDTIKKIFIRVSKKDETKEIIELNSVIKKICNNFVIKTCIYKEKDSWKKEKLDWKKLFIDDDEEEI
jgi:hypothetical protein